MSEYKNGDTVRVVLEGKVVDLYSDKQGVVVFDIEANPPARRGMFVNTDDDVVKSVEVVESPLKVGDLVEGAQYALLPAGAVVAGQFSKPLWKLKNDRWADWHGEHWPTDSLSEPRAIKYLPE